GFIDFATYKETFENPEEPGNSLIQDIVNEYAEDVGGNYHLEVYEDFQEIQAGLKEGYFLYSELILKAYMDGDIPEEPVIDEETIDRIDKAVLNERDRVAALKKAAEQEENVYYESLRTEYGTPEFFKKTREFEKKNRP